MTSAKLLTSIQEICLYLNKMEIKHTVTFKAKELSPSKYSEEYYNTFHENDYRNTFIIASQNRDYDIVLEDGSFFQFTSTNEKDIHYSFFPRIEKTLSFEQYFDEYCTDENIDSIEQEYEYYLSTDRERIYPCPIRYDVAEREYVSVIHPCAHLHIGVDTNIRIPINKVIKPLTFVDFVIKNTYKKEWDSQYLSNQDFRDYVHALKQQSEDITEEYFASVEKKMIHMI